MNTPSNTNRVYLLDKIWKEKVCSCIVNGDVKHSLSYHFEFNDVGEIIACIFGEDEKSVNSWRNYYDSEGVLDLIVWSDNQEDDRNWERVDGRLMRKIVNGDN